MTVNVNGGDPTVTGNTSATTVNWNPYGPAQLIRTQVYDDRIELIYKAESNVTYTDPLSNPTPLVWKHIIRARGDRLVKTTVYGTYHGPQSTAEWYEFPEE